MISTRSFLTLTAAAAFLLFAAPLRVSAHTTSYGHSHPHHIEVEVIHHHNDGAYDGDHHGVDAHHDDSYIPPHPRPLPRVALPPPILPGSAHGGPGLVGEEDDFMDVVHRDTPLPNGPPGGVLAAGQNRPPFANGNPGFGEAGGPPVTPVPLFGGNAFAAPLPLNGAPLSANSFYAREVFAIFNPHKGTCLTVRPNDKEPKLITSRCNLHQTFAVNSNLSFHWKPAADNNLAYLAIIYNGIQMCARHRWKGTYFYPCNEKSTKYSLSATTKNGHFQIRDATKQTSSSCMDAEFKSALRMKPCGKIFRDQRWEKMHIAFMH